MPTAKSLRVTVVTPARTVLDAEAQSVVFPACDGEWGILPGHAPLIAMLRSGVLRLSAPPRKDTLVAVRGGFIEVKGNLLTVLTPESATAQELDLGALAKESAKLSGQLVKPQEREAYRQDVAWVEARQRVLKPRT